MQLVSESNEVSVVVKPRKTIKKISKLEFLINLYQGKPGREGDPTPFEPITEIKNLAEKLKQAEDDGYFRVRHDIKVERNESKYLSETRWYLTQAENKGMIQKIRGTNE